jgi:hypothetical protein
MEYQTLEVKYVGERDIWHTPCYGEFGKWNKFWILGCPRCGEVLTLRTFGEGPQHRVISTDPVHIEPSIGCTHCRAHIFVRNGKIKVLGDF